MGIMRMMGIMGIMILAGCGAGRKPLNYLTAIGADVEISFKAFAATSGTDHSRPVASRTIKGMYDPQGTLWSAAHKREPVDASELETFYLGELKALCIEARLKKTVPSKLIAGDWLEIRKKEMAAADQATRSDFLQVQKAQANKAAKEKQDANDAKWQNDERLKRIAEPVRPGK